MYCTKNPILASYTPVGRTPPAAEGRGGRGGASDVQLGQVWRQAALGRVPFLVDGEIGKKEAEGASEQCFLLLV